MLAKPEISVNRFFDRPDKEKQFLYRLLLEEENPDKAMNNFRKCLMRINSKEVYNKLSDYNKYMLFIVSAAEYVETNDFNKYEICKVKVVKDEGVKCERCWNRVPASLVVDCLCPRCKKIMDDFADEK